VTTYSDTGLQAATTYYYRVAAFNGNGSSAFSNIASATTNQGGTASLQVDSITVSTENVGRGAKIGRAVVVISDGQGTPIGNATVSGDFSGTLNVADGIGVTDAAGSATIKTTETAKGGFNLTFCVTSVIHAKLPDFNGEVCGSL
jgi:hypothetical protein